MRIVQLTLPQKFSHFLLPVILIGFGTVPLYDLLTGNTNQYFTPAKAILVCCFFLSIGVICYIKQKSSLKFYLIISNLDVKTKNKIVRDILREHKWIYVANRHNYIQAEGNGFRNNFDLRTWSEFITIEIDSNNIAINSICDPNGMFAQAFSFGKNKQNIRDFERLFLEKSLEDK